MGIIACVEVTTTTVGTTPQTTGSSLGTTTTTTGTTPSAAGAAAAAAVISGTTVGPTSVQTTPICQRNMAIVGGPFVQSVSYSSLPTSGTDVDLTSATGNGVSFSPVNGFTGVLDNNNQPLYTITLTFNPAGADSLASLILYSTSNVKTFSVEFFTRSSPNQPFTLTPGGLPLTLTSSPSSSGPSILYFPPQVPSPISAIQINILSTTGTQ